MKKLLDLVVRYKEEESGNALVLVAISMVMICGFVALVIDGGSLFFEKSKLQKSLDAAVLAGAQELLNNDEDELKRITIEIANKNGIVLSEGDITVVLNDFVQIEKSVTKDLSFANVLGIPNAEVGALAKAQIGGVLQKREGITPVGIEKEQFDDIPEDREFIMHFQPGKSGNEPESGNFGFLDIEGNFRKALANGATMEISQEMNEATEPGLKWGIVKEEFKNKIENDADEGRTHCSNFETADDTCERVILVPIVKSYEINGKKEVEIVGFAAFWIYTIEQHEIIGKFIDIVTFGEFSDVEEESTYGISGVKLVQ